MTSYINILNKINTTLGYKKFKSSYSEGIKEMRGIMLITPMEYLSEQAAKQILDQYRSIARERKSWHRDLWAKCTICFFGKRARSTEADFLYSVLQLQNHREMDSMLEMIKPIRR